MRVLLDEMHGPAVARLLSDLGHDVMTVVGDPLLESQPDEVVLEEAGRQKRILITSNRDDFQRLSSLVLSTGHHHAPILLLSSRRYPRGPGRQMAMARDLHAALIEGRFSEDTYTWA